MTPYADEGGLFPLSGDATAALPFETAELRSLLEAFLNRQVEDPLTGATIRLGNFQRGVYSFYDYDNEPIYVGQTKEKLRTRIRRHLTNQRTDAVAMNVLDPFEVYKIVVYPLSLPADVAANPGMAKELLDALEHKIYCQAVANSKFGAVLNEKKPPQPQVEIEIPPAYEGVIVSDSVRKIRAHPDVRIARRTQTISRLAQVISERKVPKGLREVLLVQAKRLQWLAQRRLDNSADTPDTELDD